MSDQAKFWLFWPIGLALFWYSGATFGWGWNLWLPYLSGVLIGTANRWSDRALN